MDTLPISTLSIETPGGFGSAGCLFPSGCERQMTLITWRSGTEFTEILTLGLSVIPALLPLFQFDSPCLPFLTF